jgi:hypothetical protein
MVDGPAEAGHYIVVNILPNRDRLNTQANGAI